MDTALLRLFIPLLVVAGGLYLRQSKRDSDQSGKKYWKVLVAIGVAGFLLKLLLYLS